MVLVENPSLEQVRFLIHQHKPFVMVFHKRGCGFCDVLMPNFYSAAEQSSVPYFAFPATGAPKQVQGFPHLEVFDGTTGFKVPAVFNKSAQQLKYPNILKLIPTQQ